LGVDGAEQARLEKLQISCGLSSMQGIRSEMEDRATCLPHPEFNRLSQFNDDIQRSFFAVYDGHGGDVSAEYCHIHVHGNLVRDEAFGVDPIQALQNAVLRTDADFCSACRRINLVTSSGTTAICAYIEGKQLVVANVGDSRGVLCRGGKALPVSQDHKPNRDIERMRIESLGGRVGTTEEEAFHPDPSKDNCPCLRQYFSTNRPLRVFPGGLSVSRTIGDISMKGTRLIIPDPEMFTCIIRPYDSFLVLACDGVWDVLDNQPAIDLVKKYLHDPQTAAKQLAKEAYQKGSTDNISVIVVKFHQ